MTTEEFLDEKKALACVHCGLCLGSCPTYLETGNENESPRGRIYLMRAIQAGKLPVEQGSVRHIDLCLGCRACEAACPSGVQYGALLEQTRGFLERQHKRSPWQRFLRRIAIEKVFPHPARLRLALAPALFARKTGLARWLPAQWKQAVELLPADISSDPIPPFLAAYGKSRGRVGFIRGCAMDVMFAKTNRATVELLRYAGYDVISPPEQACCGALHAHSGRLAEARNFARHNIGVFASAEVDQIIINAAGCGSTLKEYAHLLEQESRTNEAAATFSGKVRDLSEFLVATGFKEQLTQVAGPKVTFHDACHLAHAQKITKAPRELVKAVAGANFVELPEADVCCGSAGTYNLTEPEMAERLQTRKIQNIRRTGAEIVVTTNPGCILQIQAGLKGAEAKGGVKVMHLADYLLGALRGG